MRWLALLAALAGSPALSLSCAPADPASDYLRAEESADVWIVVEGRLDFDAKALPKRDLADTTGPGDTDIKARLTGMSLSEAGFARPFDRDITLRVLCFGPWCGGAEPGKRYLAFLKREAGGYVLPASPCPTMYYPDPSDETLSIIETCFSGGPCKPGWPRP